jgi:hypothetical protein
LRDGSSADVRNITIDKRLHALATMAQVTRSETPIAMRREGSSSPPREPKPNFLFETCSARTTSRVVANSSPRRKQERRVLHEGASFAFCAGISRGWARAGGRGESRSLHRRVTRTPPLADRMGRKSLRVSPREGAGLRLGRARWSGHYPGGRGGKAGTGGRGVS